MNLTVLLVFVGVVVVFGVLAFVLDKQGGGKAASSRLDVLVGKKRTTESTQDILIKQQFAEVDRNKLVEILQSFIPNWRLFFEQADANIAPQSLVMFGGICALVFAAATFVATRSYLFAPVTGLLGFLVPFGWLWNKRRLRLAAFAAQLSDALELIARALRAGHSLAAGMHVVAEEMPPPISDEFGRVYEEQNLGIPLEEALEGMCKRVPNLDLRFFVTSVIIQRQTGGDLAEILDKIGHLIRERYKILGQIQALTAEGRLSGIVLIAMPFGLFLMMLHLKYDYVEKLWTHPKGIRMTVFALAMQVIGALFIKKIVDIKV
jgi:tight adherence protein B